LSGPYSRDSQRVKARWTRHPVRRSAEESIQDRTGRGPFRVKTLLDRAATGRRMRDEIGALPGRARAGDLVVVQYSGHGSLVPDRDGDEPDGLDECLCPWDVASQGPLVDDELAAIYKDRPRGVRLLMVSDSCHSGTVARFAPIRTPPTLASGRAPRRTVRFRRSCRGARRPG
jgi:hypothetical protein